MCPQCACLRGCIFTVAQSDQGQPSAATHIYKTRQQVYEIFPPRYRCIYKSCRNHILVFFWPECGRERDKGQHKMFKADFFREQIVASGVIRQICVLQQKPPDVPIAGCVRAKSYSQTCCLRKLAIDRRCDINDQCDINNQCDIITLFVIRNIISY